MQADCLTKRSPQLRDGFRRWMGDPVVSLQQSKDASAGSSNDSWRKSKVNSQQKNCPVRNLSFMLRSDMLTLACIGFTVACLSREGHSICTTYSGPWMENSAVDR